MAGLISGMRNNIFGYGGAAIATLGSLSPTPAAEPKVKTQVVESSPGETTTSKNIKLSKPDSGKPRPIDAITFDDGSYDPLNGGAFTGKPLSNEAIARKAAVVGADRTHLTSALNYYGKPSDREGYVEDTLLFVQRGILTEKEASDLLDSDIAKSGPLVDGIRATYKREITALKKLRGLAATQKLSVEDRNIAVQKAKEHAEIIMRNFYDSNSKLAGNITISSK